MQFYTLGYTGKQPEEIKQIAEELDAIIVDARYSVSSRVPHWEGVALKTLLGSRYIWLNSLGNCNYQKQYGEGIMITDFQKGKSELEKLTKPFILLCACEKYQTCHRRKVTEMLQDYNFTYMGEAQINNNDSQLALFKRK